MIIFDNTRSAITKMKEFLEFWNHSGENSRLLKHVNELDELYNKSNVSNVVDIICTLNFLKRTYNKRYLSHISFIVEGMDRDILEYGEANPELFEKYRELEELRELEKNIKEVKDMEEEQRQLVYEAKNIEDRQEELDKKKALLGKDYNQR